MRHLHFVSSIAIIMTLAACGGGGGGGSGGIGGIASTPPPPTPAASLVSTSVVTATIPTPATRPGSYDAIALIEHARSGSPSIYRLAAASDIRITTYQPGPAPIDVAYSIDFATPELPGGKTSLTSVVDRFSAHQTADGYIDFRFFDSNDSGIADYPIRFGDSLTATTSFSDGTTKTITGTYGSTDDGSSYGFPRRSSVDLISDGKGIDHRLNYNIGLSYVSLGDWDWHAVTVNPDGTADWGDEGGRVLFVHGDRTPPAAIPTAGTASYTATTLGQGQAEAHFGLTADFGQSSISASVNQDFRTYAIDERSTGYYPGLDLHGTGSITGSGSFDIPLSGTMTTYRDMGGGATQPTFSVSGALDGAFFGPNAEQVGGVFAVGQVPGNALLSDAFVGTRN
jgi:hypothetical protein